MEYLKGDFVVLFVLVDDSEKMRQNVKQIINAVMLRTEINYEIKEFTHLDKNLKELIKSDSPKIYILDIELNDHCSGVDIGKYIRSRDLDSELIYLTGHDKMFEKVFRSVYKVFDFIEKFDSMDKRLETDIRKLIFKKWDKRKFVYTNSRVNYEVFLDEILYLYRDTIERKVVIKTTGGNTFLINKNINELVYELDERFRQVHRSCIVNTDKVHLYNWAKGYFVLENTDRVELLSKKYRFEEDERL